MIENYCKDCEKEISYGGIRCKSCANKGKRNPFYNQHHSKKTKQEMSKNRKGKKHPLYGKHHSKKSKQKMKDSHKDQKAWNKGISCLKEVKEKISKKMKEKPPFKGKHHSLETKQRMREKALQRMQNYLGPFKDTKPELALQDILISLNIPFETQ